MPLTYNKVYRYPTWAIGLGWCLALSSMVCIPLAMIIRLSQTEGPFLVVSTRGRPAWGIWAGGRMLKASQLAVCYVTWGAALALSEPQAPLWPCGAAGTVGRRSHGGKMGRQRLWGPGGGPGAAASDAKMRARASPQSRGARLFLRQELGEG